MNFAALAAPAIEVTDLPAGNSTVPTSPTLSFVEDVDGELRGGANVDSYPDRCPSRETTAMLFGTQELDASEAPVATNGDWAAATPDVETEAQMRHGEEAAATAHGETEEQIRHREMPLVTFLPSQRRLRQTQMERQMMIVMKR